jgi:Rrf2 family protein
VTAIRISAKTDYALRATAELAAVPPGHRLVKVEQIATAQGIPMRFLETIMAELRQGGIVVSRRGSEGGYVLARPAEQITLAEVIRAVERPALSVTRSYAGAAAPLHDVWMAVRSALGSVLEETTLADVALNRLSPAILALARG